MFVKLALIIAAHALGGVQVTVAPDQPAPFVYSDEPLVVEFVSPIAMTAAAQVVFEGTDGGSTVDLGQVRLRAGKPFWKSVVGVPATLGVHTLRVALSSGEASRETSRVFCRLGRPAGRSFYPLYATLDGPPLVETLHALRQIRVQGLRIDGHSPSLASDIETAHRAGFPLSLSLNTDDPALDAATVESLARTQGDVVETWVLSVSGQTGQFIRVAQAIRTGSPRSRIAARPKAPADLAALIPAGAGLLFDVVAVELGSGAEADAAEWTLAAEAAGREGLSLWAIRTGPPPASTAVAILQGIAGGFERVEIPSAWLISAGEFRPGYAEAAGLATILANAAYVGRAPVDGDDPGWLFRLPQAGPKSTTWVLALESSPDSEWSTIPVGEGATNVSMRDTFGNPPEKSGDASENTSGLSGDLLYVTGTGGSVPMRAAHAEVKRIASVLAARGILDSLGPDLKAAVDSLAASDAPEPSRPQFLALIQSIPEIETQWHAGQLARSLAGPLMAGVNRLARATGVLEQELGEPFLEPLNETLAKCGEYQSLYLTGTGSTQGPHERGDWLLEEIGRLGAEARSLAESGRPVEAGAAAAIGEWRARSLDAAAEALSLSQPDPRDQALREKPAPEPKKPAAEPKKTGGRKKKS